MISRHRTSAGRRRAVLGAGLAAGMALAFAGCGASAPSSARRGEARRHAVAPAAAAGGASVSYDGPTLQNPATAPPILLTDYLGHRVDTASYRGKALLVTFIYTHCPDVCPLIVATLHNALALLGPRSSEVRIVAVSTDPAGDTRRAITTFLARRDMVGRMEYLVGSRSALLPVWRAWGVSVSNPTSQDEVNHTALVYGITGSGKITTVYPANFTPKDIAHDVPLLAGR